MQLALEDVPYRLFIFLHTHRQKNYLFKAFSHVVATGNCFEVQTQLTDPFTCENLTYDIACGFELRGTTQDGQAVIFISF